MSDMTEVEGVLKQLHDAWLAGDPEAFAACFTEDARYVAFDGDTFVGRARIAEAHRPLFKKWLAGSTLEQHSQVLREVAPGVVVINASGAVIPKGKKKASPSRISTQTYVAVKRDGQWLLASFQNTRYRPFGKTVLGRVMTWFS